MAHLKRILVILVAYASACFASGLVTGRLSYFLLPPQSGGFFEDSYTSNQVLQEAMLLGLIVCIVMAVPSFFVILLGEAFEIGNPAYYMVSALLTACMLYAVMIGKFDVRGIAIAVAAPIGGVVYWFLAARNRTNS